VERGIGEHFRYVFEHLFGDETLCHEIVEKAEVGIVLAVKGRMGEQELGFLNDLVDEGGEKGIVVVVVEISSDLVGLELSIFLHLLNHL
jgi:hypothetical protein